MTARRAAALRVALLLVCVGAAFAPAGAQTTSATLAGSVHAADGSAAGGAQVEARSVETGAVRTARADPSGAFRFEGLAPGTWLVSARSHEGSSSEPKPVVLRLQQTGRVDLTLGSGIVESTGVAVKQGLLDPEQIGGELRVDGARADALPIAGRSVTDLALLDASVRQAPAGDFYGERGAVFVVNGQSGRANTFLVDGLDNNDRTSGTSLNSFFSQQVIREFVVMTHQFAPEFGRASGGVLNILTERGGNETTGSAFFQGSSSAWNAPGDLVDSLASPATGPADAVGRFQTGFKVGGPIRAERAFYFVAAEHQQSNDVVPFTGDEQHSTGGGWVVAPNRDDNVFVRTDVQFSARQSLLVRLSADDRTTNDLNVGGATAPDAGFRVDERDVQLAAALTSVASAGVLNEARLLVGTSKFDERANSDAVGTSRPSSVFGGNNLNSQRRDEDKLQLVDNLTLQRGGHTLKFGGDVTYASTDIQTKYNPNGNFIYNTDRPFEPGDGYNFATGEDCTVPGDVLVPCPGVPGVDDDGDGLTDEQADVRTYASSYQRIFGDAAATTDDTQIALFAQDSWQATAKLRLDYGLRYDLSTFRLPIEAAVHSPIPNGGAPIDRNNVAPRFGFTYAPRPGGKLLLRGGAGVFYDKVVLGFPSVAAITSKTEIGLFFPQGFAAEVDEAFIERFGPDVIPLLFPEQVVLRFSTGTRLDTPYTNLFNLGLDWSPTPRTALRVDAVRALGYHLPIFRDLNPPRGVDQNGVPLHPADPANGSIAAIVTEGRSWYGGLDVAWRFSGQTGWFEASYTLSKALDLAPDPLKGGVYLPPNPDDLASEKARSDSDRRHRFVVSGEFPIGWLGLRGSTILQYASGAPFNVTTGADENLDGILSDRPAGLGRNTGKNTPLDVVNQLRAADGDPPVTSLEEPSLVQVDLRIFRPFTLHGRKTDSAAFLQVFNLFNRFNGANVDGSAKSDDFSRAVGLAGPPRTVEIGLRLGF